MTTSTRTLRALAALSTESLIEVLLGRYNDSKDDMLESIVELAPEVLEAKARRLDAESKVTTRFMDIFVTLFRGLKNASVSAKVFEPKVISDYATKYLGGLNAESLQLAQEHLARFLDENSASGRSDGSRPARLLKAQAAGNDDEVAKIASEPTMADAFLVSRGPAGTNIRDSAYMNPDSEVSKQLAEKLARLALAELEAEDLPEDLATSEDDDEVDEEVEASDADSAEEGELV